MKAQSRKIGKLAGLALIVVAFLTISFTADASYYGYNRNKARKVINKTAYIIEEAYSIADYYGYWSENNISRAVYYNEYAQEQFSRRNYRRAIHYSLKARDYALRVIDGCDSYWDYYYYENYGWSRYYGYNPYYNGVHHGHHYGNYNNYYNSYYNSHHNNSNNPNYNPNRPSTYNDGRGGNGRTNSFDPNKPTNNGNQTGQLKDDSRFKNIQSDSYFDKEEIGLMEDMPSETNMENDFKAEKKDVRFDDNSLKNNSKLINSNRTRSQEFQKTAPESTRQTIKLKEPKRIEEINKTRNTDSREKINDSDKIEGKRKDNSDRRINQSDSSRQNRFGTSDKTRKSRENKTIDRETKSNSKTSNRNNSSVNTKQKSNNFEKKDSKERQIESKTKSRR
ncbi:MAG: hypothetical protein PHD62_00645 [Bacteroidales bacterium]|nr:hypothetical protein [Bacteroidales bacterium]MDD4529276.1 hypothetical protein [Bacteroidales bacterium]